MSDEQKPIISLKNVKKTYNANGRELEALGDVSFDVFPHEFVSIVGPSGCGKTTLLRIIAGLLPKSSGEIIVDSNNFEITREVGFVFQKPLLLDWRKAIDNVLLPIEVLKLDRKAMMQRAQDLLALVGLEGFEDRYPGELSGGMQQRVSIARALIHDPKMLLMDEPFGALDAITRERLNIELLRIWEETRKTILFITHDINEAVFLSDRVIVLSARPSRMVESLDIELPRPRAQDVRAKPKFGEYSLQIYKSLEIG
ncbi:MAG TPA: ABC transporter ATP-binding protein [Rectinema sp.]|nr:ABC transporter ATP-binding protein [Rectinema sp.]HOU61028.1 ABC transporter ATP-binding protein [Rectinema sp.]HPN03300.1 ABC transporter ATP-binding protein [Rectinema sp.]HQH87837.1 ABC transporter ATP-binding protein [Rectinema sp.]HQJ23250.1 ABC transporter ATP-binding protein [Rectinema sp.]